jgi:uncharacterized protein YjiS (DUF1127 family)
MSLIDHVSRQFRVVAAKPRAASLTTRLALWKSRRALARMDADRLDDIGITQKAAHMEAEKGIWDVPESWLNR